MNVYLGLLGKDLKLMRGWMLGGIAIMAAVSLLGGWLAYRQPVGAVSFLMTFPLFLHLFYIPVFLWISLSREWKDTPAMWLQLPRSGWGLLAAKLVSSVIGFVLSYAVAFALFYGISAMEINRFAGPPFAADFDPIVYVEYMQRSFIGVFLLVIYTSLNLGVWTILFKVSVQAVKRTLRRFSWLAMFVVFALLFWGYVALSETAAYSALTDWGAFTGDSVWAYLELKAGEFILDLPIMALFFYLAGWLMDRKVEV